MINRVAFESQFKSTGYYGKTSTPDQIKSLLTPTCSTKPAACFEKAVENIFSYQLNP